MNIASTVIPPQQPTLEEWYKEFKVGAQAPKFNDRAADMNSHYDFSIKESASVIEKVLLRSNK